MNEKINIELELDSTWFKKDLTQAENFARDTWKKLDPLLTKKLELEFWEAKVQLREVQESVRKTRKEFDAGLISRKQLKDAEAGLKNVSSATTEAGRRLQNYRNTGDPALSRIQDKVNQLNWWFSRMKGFLIWVGSAIVSAFSVRKLQEVSDTFQSMQNQIAQVAEWGDIDKIQNKIAELANNSRVPIDSLTSSFVRFELVNRQIWGTTEETFTILDTLSKWLINAGSTASETSSVMLQLAQAFGSWRLAGDEFRSVSENLPIILDILAKKLQVPRGELKELASQWVITSDVLKEALIEANEWITEAFEKTNTTIWQALTQSLNKFILKFWELDKTYWITQKIVNWIDAITKAFFSWISFLEKYSWAIVELTRVVWALIWAKALLWLYKILPLLAWRIVAMTGVLTATTGVVTWLRVAMLWLMTAMWPLWIAFAAISVAIYWVSKATSYMSEKQEESRKTSTKLTKALEQNQKEQDKLNKQWEKWAIDAEEYNKKISDLQKESDVLSKWLNATSVEGWNLNEALTALANTEYAPNTEWYRREREEIIKNINETINLLEARKALGITNLDQDTKEFETLNKEVEKTNTSFWQWSTSQASGVLSEINYWLNEQIQLQEEIKKQKENILNIDELIADIRSGSDYQWTSWDISTGGSSSSSGWSTWKTLEEKLKEKESEALKQLEEQKKKLAEREEKRNDKLIQNVEDLEDQYKIASDILEDSLDKSSDAVDDFNDKIKDTQEEILKLWDDSEKSASNMAKSFWGTDSELRKTFENLAKNVWGSLESFNGSEVFAQDINGRDIDAQDIRDFIEAKKEQLDIEKEIRLAEINIQDLEKNKADEEKILEKFTNAKIQFDENYQTIKMNIEQEITDDMFRQGLKRDAILEKTRLKAIETAKALRDANMLSSSSSSWSTNNVNNSTSTSIWTINVTDNTAVQSLERTLNTNIQ